MTACDCPRRLRLTTVGLVALTFAWGALPAAARAEAPRPSVSAERHPKHQTKRETDRAKQAAQQHLERGNQLFTRDEIAEALAEFQAAFNLYPSPKLHFNLGQCERALGHNEAAAGHFEIFLADAADVSPELRAEAQRYLAEARAPVVPASDPTAAPEPAAEAPATVEATPVAPPLPPAPPPRQAEPVIVTPPREATPLYARWWFWAAIGAVVVGGTVTAIALSRPRDPPCDPGMSCF